MPSFMVCRTGGCMLLPKAGSPFYSCRRYGGGDIVLTFPVPTSLLQQTWDVFCTSADWTSTQDWYSMIMATSSSVANIVVCPTATAFLQSEVQEATLGYGCIGNLSSANQATHIFLISCVDDRPQILWQAQHQSPLCLCKHRCFPERLLLFW